MRASLQTVKPLHLWLALATVLTAAAGTASAAGIIIQNGQIPELWITPPDPFLFPTDYQGNASTPPSPGDYVDSSSLLAWGSGVVPEPGPHGYNLKSATIHMANAPDSNKVKLVWVKLAWSPPNAAGLPTFQPTGEMMDPIKWPTITSPSGVDSPIELGWGDTTLGTRVLTMKFLIDPQPAWEDIKLGVILGTDPVHHPNSISVQTICIPTPTGAAALGVIGGLLTMSRRRRAIA